MLPTRLCVRYVRTLVRSRQLPVEEPQTKQVQHVQDGAFTLEPSTSMHPVERQLLDTYERKLFPDEADVERVRFPAREPQTTIAKMDYKTLQRLEKALNEGLPRPYETDGTKPLTPARAYNLLPFVNQVSILRRLLDTGVNLAQVQSRHPTVCERLLQLSYKRDVLPRWKLMERLQMSEILSNNPYILWMSLEDLRERIAHMQKAMKLTKPYIGSMLRRSPYLINFKSELLDKRLRFLRDDFSLSRSELRQALLMDPELPVWGTGAIKRMTFTLVEECEFNDAHLRQMLINDPKLFRCDPVQVRAAWVYLIEVAQVQADKIAACPRVLRLPQYTLRTRHKFARAKKRAQYNDETNTETYVPLHALAMLTDAEFCQEAEKEPVNAMRKNENFVLGLRIYEPIRKYSAQVSLS